MKSQGNQITKLKVKEIVLDHDIEGDIPWPEPEKKPAPTNEDGSNSDDDNEEGGSPTVEWDMTKDENDDDQPKLF
jgi:topoisomerase-4 subunit A